MRSITVQGETGLGTGWMELLAMPGIDPAVFIGLSAASFATAFLGVFTGAAGGLVLLGIMAMVLPPGLLVPLHTVVQFGSGVTRTIIMWRYVMRGTLLPFFAGSAVGAMSGAQIFVSLSTAWLLAILGVFILIVTWMPKLGNVGTERGRFAALGFATTFLGVFVSATGTLVAPFVASAAPDRHHHAATLGALMAVSHVTKLAAFGFMGFSLGSFIPLVAAMILTGALGNWTGELALNHTSERRFRTILQIVLTILGLRLLWSAAVAGGWI